jgi:exosortase
VSGADQADRRIDRWLAAAALAALWVPLCVRWSRLWAATPELAYGWGVPVLALYLARERWRSRPQARPPGRAGRAASVAAGAAGLALFLAALPVLEANELWPTAQWAGALGASAATLAGLWLAGGAAWASNFAFPVAFVFTALAWPTAVHLWVIRVLVAGNAGMAAEIVSTLGHPAVVNGNVITVANGLVGVDEACSGLRSLQSVWMAAWFLGEFHRLNWPRRLALVAASAAVALAANLARTTFLTWLAASHSIAASERWHDRAGIAELVVTLAIVALLAERAARKGRPPGPAAAPPGPVRWPVGWSVAALAAALLAEGSTQAWYLWHEWRAPAAHVRWTLVAPDPSWRPVPIPGRAQSILQYSSGSGLEWSDPASDSRAWVFVLNWEGDAAEGENPEWHDPTICLPASGVRQTADLGGIPLVLGGIPVEFTGYRFTVGRSPLEVFFCHWDAGLAEARSEGDAVDYRLRRLQRVREGRRRGDVAHLILEVSAPDDAAALAWLRAWAPRLLRPALR